MYASYPYGSDTPREKNFLKNAGKYSNLIEARIQELVIAVYKFQTHKTVKISDFSPTFPFSNSNPKMSFFK